MSDTVSETSRSSVVAAGRHPVSVAHLVMGLVFLCITAGWGLVQAGAVTGSDIRWLLPIPWLVAGAAGLAVMTTRGLRQASTDQPTRLDPADIDTRLQEKS